MNDLSNKNPICAVHGIVLLKPQSQHSFVANWMNWFHHDLRADLQKCTALVMKQPVPGPMCWWPFYEHGSECWSLAPSLDDRWQCTCGIQKARFHICFIFAIQPIPVIMPIHLVETIIVKLVKEKPWSQGVMIWAAWVAGTSQHLMDSRHKLFPSVKMGKNYLSQKKFSKTRTARCLWTSLQCMSMPLIGSWGTILHDRVFSMQASIQAMHSVLDYMSA